MRRVSAFLPLLAVIANSESQFRLSDPAPAVPNDPVAHAIVSRALKDGIDLSVFPFSGPALQEIVFWSHFDPKLSELPPSLFEPEENVTTIDVHVHYIPKWYGEIRQDPTEWNLGDHLVHMRNQSIAESIFSIPNPNIFLGDKDATLTIARLLNENMAALVRVLPCRFSFFATTPLPYVHASITEAQYALETLGALGVALASNHEGRYLGDTSLTPFFAAMDDRHTIVFVHPFEALLEVNQTFIKANPTAYSPVLAEFYEDIFGFGPFTDSYKFHKLGFYHIASAVAGGAGLDDVMVALRTRCWWDSAGLTYSHQLGGLLAYNISPSFLLYGSDYPYIPSSLVDASSEAIARSPFLNEEQKHQVKNENTRRLFGGRKRSEAGLSF